MIYDQPKQMPQPILKYKGTNWCGGKLVVYPVSYRYNGGTIINGDWYPGYDVPFPKLPEGYELIEIGMGLNLNAHPPLATALMKKKSAPFDILKISDKLIP